MLKGEQFGEDNLLKPRMAVADNGKVAAPAENATNVVPEEKKVTTITENDNSAGKTYSWEHFWEPHCFVWEAGRLVDC